MDCIDNTSGTLAVLLSGRFGKGRLTESCGDDRSVQTTGEAAKSNKPYYLQRQISSHFRLCNSPAFSRPCLPERVLVSSHIEGSVPSSAVALLYSGL
jgi:hypothetical protein